MNIEPQKSKRTISRLQLKDWLRSLPKRMLKLITHNWAWKLCSLLLALCLWAGLITQDPTLTRERVFTDVTASVVGSDTLRRNGLIVLSGLDDEALNVRLRADVPQREYNSASPVSYNPRVDLSRITETGEQTLKFTTTSTTTYGTVQSILPDSVTVVVDEYVTNYRVPVTIVSFGEYPAGFYGTTPTADPSVVAVSGPESVVSRITRVFVDFDVSKLPSREGVSRNALNMRFADAEGNAVVSDLLEVTSSGVLLRSVIVQQQLYPSKQLAVNALGLTSGEPAVGYRLAGVDVSPVSVLAAGEGDALSVLESLSVATPADVSGKSEDFSVDVRLDRPDGVSYLSADMVTLSVRVEPVSVTRTFDNIKLSVVGRSDAYRAALASKTVSVHLTGPQNLLSGLKATAISAFVDVTGLTEGEHQLPVQVQVEGLDMSQLSSALSLETVGVTLSPR